MLILSPLPYYFPDKERADRIELPPYSFYTFHEDDLGGEDFRFGFSPIPLG
jgi:hypothetical protein